jgi:hypothetical protein
LGRLNCWWNRSIEVEVYLTNTAVLEVDVVCLATRKENVISLEAYRHLKYTTKRIPAVWHWFHSHPTTLLTAEKLILEAQVVKKVRLEEPTAATTIAGLSKISGLVIAVIRGPSILLDQLTNT